ncbi:hypothetical protein ACIRTB_01670 [Streptomyces sp. NPDC101158]|uniref:hypothetical protein n=1 Tax=Streptomyces sp. NPDC101158 TaxID=3366117 RepID=UPI0038287902
MRTAPRPRAAPAALRSRHVVTAETADTGTTGTAGTDTGTAGPGTTGTPTPAAPPRGPRAALPVPAALAGVAEPLPVRPRPPASATAPPRRERAGAPG